jgi:probable rRNA maturation factor
MSVEIRIKARFSSSVARGRLRRLAERTLRAEGVKASATVYVTDNAEIRKLNRQFHATDAATDVLSFPTGPFPTYGRVLDSDYVGDVVISYEQARKQARAARWHIVEELELLTIHGILHLIGYDDLTPRTRKRMWKRQAELLNSEQ